MHQSRTEASLQVSAVSPDAGKVAVFTMGGTLDKVYFDALSRYEVGTPVIQGILKEAGVNVPYEITELMQKDSLELNDADRGALREAIADSAARHILVTHGTDTMVESARALEGLDKTIVLTGALKPARFRETDAVFNVAAAFVAAQVLPCGVWVAMNGRVFDSEHVRKNRDANRFEEA